MDKASPINIQDTVSPGFFRRLAVMCYDALLLCAILISAAALVVVPLGLGLGVKIPTGYPPFTLYLLLICIGFFIWFWLRGGQTLGMRAWRVRVVRENGLPLRLRDALLRLLTSLISWLPLGLGFLWVLVDSNKLAWHDRLSKTRLVMLQKKPDQPKRPAK